MRSEGAVLPLEKRPLLFLMMNSQWIYNQILPANVTKPFAWFNSEKYVCLKNVVRTQHLATLSFWFIYFQPSPESLHKKINCHFHSCSPLTSIQLSLHFSLRRRGSPCRPTLSFPSCWSLEVYYNFTMKTFNSAIVYLASQFQKKKIGRKFHFKKI